MASSLQTRLSWLHWKSTTQCSRRRELYDLGCLMILKGDDAEPARRGSFKNGFSLMNLQKDVAASAATGSCKPRSGLVSWKNLGMIFATMTPFGVDDHAVYWHAGGSLRTHLAHQCCLPRNFSSSTRQTILDSLYITFTHLIENGSCHFVRAAESITFCFSINQFNFVFNFH